MSRRLLGRGRVFVGVSTASLVLAACGSASVSTAARSPAVLAANFSTVEFSAAGVGFATVIGYQHGQVVEEHGGPWYLGTPTGTSTRAGLVLSVTSRGTAWAAEVAHGSLDFSALYVGAIDHWSPQLLNESVAPFPGSVAAQGGRIAYVLEGNTHYGRAQQSLIKVSGNGAIPSRVMTSKQLVSLTAAHGCVHASFRSVVVTGGSPQILASCANATRALMLSSTGATWTLSTPTGYRFSGFSSVLDQNGKPTVAAIVQGRHLERAYIFQESGSTFSSLGYETLAHPASQGPSLAVNSSTAVVLVPQGAMSRVIQMKGSRMSQSAGPAYGAGVGLTPSGTAVVVAADPKGVSVSIDTATAHGFALLGRVAIPTGDG
ncbi:MAG: hypothetical protein ACYDHP_01590 [Ferrimicrobium sp.]